jgi:hypothetical protein
MLKMMMKADGKKNRLRNTIFVKPIPKMKMVKNVINRAFPINDKKSAFVRISITVLSSFPFLDNAININPVRVDNKAISSIRFVCDIPITVFFMYCEWIAKTGTSRKSGM